MIEIMFSQMLLFATENRICGQSLGVAPIQLSQVLNLPLRLQICHKFTTACNLGSRVYIIWLFHAERQLSLIWKKVWNMGFVSFVIDIIVHLSIHPSVDFFIHFAQVERCENVYFRSWVCDCECINVSVCVLA